ncbi:MAG: DUF3575 domain-containing protein [Prevotellaceae bacterium]|nr:DUF3575 domain-containing protein [Prevotellaceae bacterium]
MKWTKHLLAVTLLTTATLSVSAQVGVKTNLAGWATTTTNVGVEVGLSKRSTFQVMGYLNPWNFSDDRHFHLWTVQPEYRYWFGCGKYNGHFLGIHALGGEYNAKNLNFPLKALTWGNTYEQNAAFPVADHEGGWPDLRGKNAGRHVEGWYIGAGITYGYQWILSKHWNFEGSIGAGYVYSPMKYYGRCKQCINKRRLHYAGPTNAQLSLIYIF